MQRLHAVCIVPGMPASPLEIRLGDLDARLDAAIDDGSRVIWLCGPKGSGKTRFLSRWCRKRETPFLQIEPITATPEMLSARARDIVAPSSAAAASRASRGGSQSGFEDFLRLFRSGGLSGPVGLDELSELRRLSYFPGIHDPLERALQVMLRRPAPSVATCRFPFWLAGQHDAPYTSRHMHRIDLPEPTESDLDKAGIPSPADLLRITGGLLMHVEALGSRLIEGQTLAHALDEGLRYGARVECECRASLAELLHRARGYGACKAVLSVLAEEEPLTLSEIARRLDRTPGSTRDYLRWLEEVDLIKRDQSADERGARRKRYRYQDPILRLWMRLYGRGALPEEAVFAREIGAHLERSPLVEPVTESKSEPDKKQRPSRAPVERTAVEDAPFELPEPTIYGPDELVEID